MATNFVLSGNTFEVKDLIKQIGFRWDSLGKHWRRTTETLAVGQEALERNEAALSIGVRAVAQRSEDNRIVWWKDYGTVVHGVQRNEGEDDQPSATPAPARMATTGGNIYPTGSVRVETPNPAAATSTQNNDERIAEVPQWLSRQLGCSRVLRGRVLETAYRQVTLRDGRVRNVNSYHFVGHNEVGGTTHCYRCGRQLTHPVSRVVGYGPECCQALGISRRVDMNDINNVELMDRLIREQAVDVWIPVTQTRLRQPNN